MVFKALKLLQTVKILFKKDCKDTFTQIKYFRVPVLGPESSSDLSFRKLSKLLSGRLFCSDKWRMTKKDSIINMKFSETLFANKKCFYSRMV